MKELELKYVKDHWESVESFLGYVDLHSDTPRALFNKVQCAEMYHLMGDDKSAEEMMTSGIEWQGVDFRDWVKEIKEKMKPEPIEVQEVRLEIQNWKDARWLINCAMAGIDEAYKKGSPRHDEMCELHRSLEKQLLEQVGEDYLT